MDHSPRLAISGLRVTRGAAVVLDGVSVRAAAGALLLLRGPNGCGKSTLLRAAAGLVPARAGRIMWDGADVTRDRTAHAAHMLHIGHADPARPGLTAREALGFHLSIMGGGPARGADARRRVDEALGIWGLAAAADHRTETLSAGRRRRLSLARLALCPRGLWLLDEPEAALDQAGRETLWLHIAAMRAQGGVVVMATHHSRDGAGDDDGATTLHLSMPGDAGDDVAPEDGA